MQKLVILDGIRQEKKTTYKLKELLSALKKQNKQKKPTQLKNSNDHQCTRRTGITKFILIKLLKVYRRNYLEILKD